MEGLEAKGLPSRRGSLCHSGEQVLLEREVVRTLAPGGTGLLEGSRRIYFRRCFSCRGCFSSRGSMREGSWTQVLDILWLSVSGLLHTSWRAL